MTTYRGLPACTCLAQWCAAFEAKIGRSPRLFQLVGDAPASAGFHRGGGSADYETLSISDLRTARNMGGAAWNRGAAQGFSSNHCHIRLNGCPHNSIAQPQVADLNKGLDGTGPLGDSSGRKDNGPRDGVQWPLRTWQQGIEWSDDVSAEEVWKYGAVDNRGTTDPADDQKVTALDIIRRGTSLAYQNQADIKAIRAEVDEIKALIGAPSGPPVLTGADLLAIAEAVIDEMKKAGN